jgi:phenylpropionate dioxygenase-like ring-hydroxylating dioxygenase large terminal subunit
VKVSEIPGLRDQWYAVARVEDAHAGTPLPVRLFGQDYTLWAPGSGSPVLAQPFCPHRGARLAAGSIKGDRLVCIYHGWEFAPSGLCMHVPQLEPGLPVPPKARTQTWPVVERYGLCWACVGEPATDGPPPWREADELGWRVQVDFLEPWAASALRIVDNNLDLSHPSFVHQGTFGDPSRPLVAPYELERTAAGFRAQVPQDVGGVGPQMGEADEGRRFERTQDTELLSPVQTRIRLRYEGSAPDYAFYGSATPLDDQHSLYVRVSALAGTETEQPYAMFWEFSRRVTIEDKVVLEQTNPDFHLDVTAEVHLRCDKVTLEFRRQLARLAGLGGAGDRSQSPAAQSPVAGPPPQPAAAADPAA